MGFGAVALVDVPVHTRHRVVELVRYVYAKYSQLLSPPAYALITYHSEMPGECWLNMFDRRYVMKFSVSSRKHEIKVKPSDEYNDLDTEEFDDLLEDASGLADSYKASNNIPEALDDYAAAIYITGNSHASPAVEPDSQHSSDSESESSDSGWLVHDDSELTDNEYSPDNAGHDDNDSTDNEEQQEEEYEPADSQGDSNTAKQWGKLQQDATRVAQRQSCPRAPVTPEHPVHVKQESQPEASNRATTQNHARRVQRATAQTARQTPVTPEQPVWVKQEDQPESSRRAAAREHARPELESVPGMKRLKKRMSTDGGVGPSTPLQTGVNLNEVTVLAGQAQSYSPVAPGQSGVPEIKIEACIDLTQSAEPSTPLVSALTSPQSQSQACSLHDNDPSGQRHSRSDSQHCTQQQLPCTACDCGLPTAVCNAPDCTALYCRSCDRKLKQQDPFKGFQFCSSACCRKVKFCEQHRKLLKMCIACDALCCKRATCNGCNITICSDCKDKHQKEGQTA